MTCLEVDPLLGASFDNELDLRTALAIEQHLSTCDSCTAQFKRLEWLREEIVAAGPDWSAGADLKVLRASIQRPSKTSWMPALAAVAAALLVTMFLPSALSRGGKGMERQLVDSHVRSLMANHLVDVPSSDRHTVKPWFQGKLGFSPSVPDLAADGFVLIGGRLDVVASRPAAAIVYKRQNHVINLWISEIPAGIRQPELTDLDGYHVLRWRYGGMACWAVSDVNAAELREFKASYQSR